MRQDLDRLDLLRLFCVTWIAEGPFNFVCSFDGGGTSIDFLEEVQSCHNSLVCRLGQEKFGICGGDRYWDLASDACC